jgi:hypothetical protein
MPPISNITTTTATGISSNNLLKPFFRTGIGDGLEDGFEDDLEDGFDEGLGV